MCSQYIPEQLLVNFKTFFCIFLSINSDRRISSPHHTGRLDTDLETCRQNQSNAMEAEITGVAGVTNVTDNRRSLSEGPTSKDSSRILQENETSPVIPLQNISVSDSYQAKLYQTNRLSSCRISPTKKIIPKIHENYFVAVFVFLLQMLPDI